MEESSCPLVTEQPSTSTTTTPLRQEEEESSAKAAASPLVMGCAFPSSVEEANATTTPTVTKNPSSPKDPPSHQPHFVENCLGPDVTLIQNWLLNHAGMFRQPVFGPVGTLVRAKSVLAAAMLEDYVPCEAWKYFIVKSEADAQLFSKKIQEEFGLQVFLYNMESQCRLQARLSDSLLDQLKTCGIQGCLDDELECHAAVIQFLQDFAAIHQVLVARTALTPESILQILRVLRGHDTDEDADAKPYTIAAWFDEDMCSITTAGQNSFRTLSLAPPRFLWSDGPDDKVTTSLDGSPEINMLKEENEDSKICCTPSAAKKPRLAVCTQDSIVLNDDDEEDDDVEMLSPCQAAEEVFKYRCKCRERWFARFPDRKDKDQWVTDQDFGDSVEGPLGALFIPKNRFEAALLEWYTKEWMWHAYTAVKPDTDTLQMSTRYPVTVAFVDLEPEIDRPFKGCQMEVLKLHYGIKGYLDEYLSIPDAVRRFLLAKCPMMASVLVGSPLSEEDHNALLNFLSDLGVENTTIVMHTKDGNMLALDITVWSDSVEVESFDIDAPCILWDSENTVNTSTSSPAYGQGPAQTSENTNDEKPEQKQGALEFVNHARDENTIDVSTDVTKRARILSLDGTYSEASKEDTSPVPLSLRHVDGEIRLARVNISEEQPSMHNTAAPGHPEIALASPKAYDRFPNFVSPSGYELQGNTQNAIFESPLPRVVPKALTMNINEDQSSKTEAAWLESHEDQKKATETSFKTSNLLCDNRHECSFEKGHDETHNGRWNSLVEIATANAPTGSQENDCRQIGQIDLPSDPIKEKSLPGENVQESANNKVLGHKDKQPESKLLSAEGFAKFFYGHEESKAPEEDNRVDKQDQDGANTDTNLEPTEETTDQVIAMEKFEWVEEDGEEFDDALSMYEGDEDGEQPGRCGIFIKLIFTFTLLAAFVVVGWFGLVTTVKVWENVKVEAEQKATERILNIVAIEVEGVSHVIQGIGGVLDESDELSLRLAKIRNELEGTLQNITETKGPFEELLLNVNEWDRTLVVLRHAVSGYVATSYLEGLAILKNGVLATDGVSLMADGHGMVDEWKRQEEEIAEEIMELEVTRCRLSKEAAFVPKERSSYFRWG